MPMASQFRFFIYKKKIKGIKRTSGETHQYCGPEQRSIYRKLPRRPYTASSSDATRRLRHSAADRTKGLPSPLLCRKGGLFIKACRWIFQKELFLIRTTHSETIDARFDRVERSRGTSVSPETAARGRM